MKLRPTDNHSIRSITRRVLLLGISSDGRGRPLGTGRARPTGSADRHRAAAAAHPAGTDRPPPHRGRPTAPGGPHPAGSLGAHADRFGNSWSACGTRRSAPTATHSRRGCHPPRGPASNRTTGYPRVFSRCPSPTAPSVHRSTVTAAAGRWCSTHPASAAPATAAPSWSRNWSAADTSWSPSITPTTPPLSSSPTGASKPRRYRTHPKPANRRSRSASPTPASS